ncbi:hypothetical protein FACS1894187_25270 [Synergistales bacterium]|nr:hypothetical protein FACS1894187_25270 [Synergistales bacterium]
MSQFRWSVQYTGTVELSITAGKNEGAHVDGGETFIDITPFTPKFSIDTDGIFCAITPAFKIR